MNPKPLKQSELSHLALSDELTGLYNRRGFLLLGSERMKLAHSMEKNVLLFFADLDNLKQINDQYGHQEGDQALLKTSDVFRDTFRNSDIIGRFGGDESPPWSLRSLATRPTRSPSACRTTWRNSPPTILISRSRCARA